MDEHDSLSKGCFIYKTKKPTNPFNQFGLAKWHGAFDSCWSTVNDKLLELNNDLSSNVINNLIKFIGETEVSLKIPTAVILTGVNLPDHVSLFNQIVRRVKSDTTPHVAHLRCSMCRNTKNMIEATVSQMINSNSTDETEDELSQEDSDDETHLRKSQIKKRDCNMRHLLKWFEVLSHKVSPSKKRKKNPPKLIVIVSDFEGFSPRVLRDFIMILSGYVPKLPIFLIFGVATTASALSQSLEHCALSRISIHIFKSEKSVHCLNRALDEVFLNDKCPFLLGPNIFKFLCNVFLFYDFSVHNFTLGVKYALMDHFLGQNVKVLCTEKENFEDNLTSLSKEEINEVFNIPSFQQYIETVPSEIQDKIKNSTKSLKNTVKQLSKSCYERVSEFFLCLKILHLLVHDLPQAPLGKLLREVYVFAIAGEIEKLPSYKECSKMLTFHSKFDLIEKISKILNVLKDNCNSEFLNELNERLKEYKITLDQSDINLVASPMKTPQKMEFVSKSRSEFKKAIVDLGKSHKKLSPFELTRKDFIHYIFEEVLPVGLESITKLPLHEIIYCDGKVTLRRRIVGCPRADVHLALTEPQHYLMCKCCKLNDPKEIVNTLPDICILYKLHLECGSLINLYDWLLSFSAILNPDFSEDSDAIDPQLQARFMQVVAELEFLGFIKASNRKKDHVARLTWGGS